MSSMQVIVWLTVLVTAASVVNYHFLRLPTSVGIMLFSIVISSTAIALRAFDITLLHEGVAAAIQSVNFYEALMNGMLGALLFAGALQIDLNSFLEKRIEIIVLSTVGVLLSTICVGGGLYFGLQLIGLPIPFLYCLLFGALISPTDPVAVLSILKEVHAPPSLAMKVAGESLFNDGIGVVVFTVILGLALGGESLSVMNVSTAFLRDAGGGMLYGFVLGYLGYRLLKTIDNYEVEILVTLAMVLGGYALASSLHVSGPLAMVVAGLFIGNHGKKFAMSERTREHLTMFWGFLEEILNAALFALMGLEMIVISLQFDYIVAGTLAVFVVLLARLVSVWIPVRILGQCGRRFSKGAVSIMTWGGLRGGICIALALYLPMSEERNLLITMTYVVVAFSVLIQGLTMKSLVRHYQ